MGGGDLQDVSLKNKHVIFFDGAILGGIDIGGERYPQKPTGKVDSGINIGDRGVIQLIRVELTAYDNKTPVVSYIQFRYDSHTFSVGERQQNAAVWSCSDDASGLPVRLSGIKYGKYIDGLEFEIAN